MENFIFYFILLEMKAKRELNFELYVCHEIFVRLEIQTLMILQNMPIFQHKWSCANLSFIFRYSWTFCFEKNTTLVWITWLSLKCKACNNCKCNSLKSFFSLITTRYTQIINFVGHFFDRQWTSLKDVPKVWGCVGLALLNLERLWVPLTIFTSIDFGH